MTPFEFIFSLLGLLLGLALAAVLNGLATTLKSRRHIRVGLLTPVLGILVSIDLTSFWLTAWGLRKVMTLDMFTLLGSLLIVGLYYVIASLVFPDNPREWPVLDTYYDRHKRYVLGGVVLCNVLAEIAEALLGRNPFPDLNGTLVVAFFIACALTAALVKSHRVNLAVLLVMIAVYPISSLM